MGRHREDPNQADDHWTEHGDALPAERPAAGLIAGQPLTAEGVKPDAASIWEYRCTSCGKRFLETYDRSGQAYCPKMRCQGVSIAERLIEDAKPSEALGEDQGALADARPHREAEGAVVGLREVVAREGHGAAVVAGWVVGNANDDQWRSWEFGAPVWVTDRDRATRYARREDAEAVHAEDEDAWRVTPYVEPASNLLRRLQTLAHYAGTVSAAAGVNAAYGRQDTRLSDDLWAIIASQQAAVSTGEQPGMEGCAAARNAPSITLPDDLLSLSEAATQGEWEASGAMGGDGEYLLTGGEGAESWGLVATTLTEADAALRQPATEDTSTAGGERDSANAPVLALEEAVRALRAIAGAKTKIAKHPDSYHGGFDAGCDWAASCAERALAKVATITAGRE